MDPCTPKVLFDLYCMLLPEQRLDFLKRVASTCSAKEPLMMVEEMTRRERRKFTDLTVAKVVETTLPLLMRTARKLIRENPRLSDEQFERELDRRFQEWGDAAVQEISALEREQLKEQRDPKPRNTERDAEIIRLAKQGKTSGEIHRAIKARWECTPGAVNQVIIRAKRTGLLPK